MIRLLVYYLSSTTVYWWNSYYLICDSNGIWTHSHLVYKWTLNHLATSDMALASNKEFLDIQANYRMWIHSETRKWWHDDNIQSNAPYRQVVTTQIKNVASLAKWLSVRLLTKWLWVRILLLSRKLQISSLLRARSSLTFRQTIECRFILKIVRDMIITYSH